MGNERTFAADPVEGADCVHYEKGVFSTFSQGILLGS